MFLKCQELLKIEIDPLLARKIFLDGLKRPQTQFVKNLSLDKYVLSYQILDPGRSNKIVCNPAHCLSPRVSVARVEMSRSQQQQSSQHPGPGQGAVLEPKTLGDSGPEATRALSLGAGAGEKDAEWPCERLVSAPGRDYAHRACGAHRLLSWRA